MIAACNGKLGAGGNTKRHALRGGAGKAWRQLAMEGRPVHAAPNASTEEPQSASAAQTLRDGRLTPDWREDRPWWGWRARLWVSGELRMSSFE
jgi:L-aminopeptidase/D-esterase-like protein